jgi:hypothetical protein
MTQPAGIGKVSTAGKSRTSRLSFTFFRGAIFQSAKLKFHSFIWRYRATTAGDVNKREQLSDELDS